MVLPIVAVGAGLFFGAGVAGVARGVARSQAASRENASRRRLMDLQNMQIKRDADRLRAAQLRYLDANSSIFETINLQSQNALDMNYIQYRMRRNNDGAGEFFGDFAQGVSRGLGYLMDVRK
ncbi:hypothetical protein pCXcHC2016_32 [Xenohaliotis phage pCXc-HC2016]|nr:hypothetical protein pCXcHC2016_32 [Xenohaliotis phage pCXc-HC2016]AQW89139.1 hypothetical protein pCXcHR2015_32 [Xenohaliotis phage pCXc-HR2015]